MKNTPLSPMQQEAVVLFTAYLAKKGRKAIRREWLECQGPWYSILIRNSFGLNALRYLGRNIKGNVAIKKKGLQ